MKLRLLMNIAVVVGMVLPMPGMIAMQSQESHEAESKELAAAGAPSVQEERESEEAVADIGDVYVAATIQYSDITVDKKLSPAERRKQLSDLQDSLQPHKENEDIKGLLKSIQKQIDGEVSEKADINATIGSGWASDLREQVQRVKRDSTAKRGQASQIEAKESESKRGQDTARATLTDSERQSERESQAEIKKAANQERENKRAAEQPNKNSWFKYIFGGAFVALAAAVFGYMLWTKKIAIK